MLLNSFSSYSSGSSDLSSIVGGVSVEELEKVKESRITKKAEIASYSSAQNAPLDEILNVSGSGVLLACILTDGMKHTNEHSVLKVEIDGETIFYRSLTYSTGSSSQATLGLACSDAMYFDWSSNAGATYLPYDCARGIGNNTYYRSVTNSFTVLDNLKTFEEINSYGGYIVIIDAPVRFENSLKVSATYYGDAVDGKQYLINTRYILD